VQTEIPLNDAAPADITDQVTEYFKLGENADVATKEEPAKEKESAVVTVSLAHE
jgi:hypothetical protein